MLPALAKAGGSRWW